MNAAQKKGWKLAKKISKKAASKEGGPKDPAKRGRYTKRKAIEYMGGGCLKCGYSKCAGALEFHHKDPRQKDYSISRKLHQQWERIQEELDKCVMLCANCHREEHARIRAQLVEQRADNS